VIKVARFWYYHHCYFYTIHLFIHRANYIYGLYWWTKFEEHNSFYTPGVASGDGYFSVVTSECLITFFFWETQYNRRMSQHVHAHTPMNAYTYTLPLWTPPIDWADGSGLGVDEVITGISLSTETSPPLKEYSAFYTTHGFERRWAGVQPPS